MQSALARRCLGAAAISALILGLATTARADDVQIDNDISTPAADHSVSVTVAPGATVLQDAQTVVSWQGNNHLAPSTTATPSSVTMHLASVTTTLGTNTSVPNPSYSVPDATGAVPPTWASTSPDFGILSHISVTAPSTPGVYQINFKFLPTNFTCAPGGAGCLSPTATGDPFIINLTVSGPSTPSNTAPVVAFTTAPTTTDEGTNQTFAFSIVDPDAADTQAYSNGYPSCGTGNSVVGTPTITNSGGSFTCNFPDGVVPAAKSTVSVQVSDGAADSNLATTDITVNNVIPTVASTLAFASASTNCQSSVSLTGFSFSDPGVNDANWAVEINWGDGSTHSTFNASAQGAQDSPTHVYTAGGTFTASVTVTDKDGGTSAAVTSSNSIVVIQYATSFLQPFDGSSPSRLITNTMKSGRVVPVKATIFDYCANAYVTTPASVTIAVNMVASATTPAPDTVETYADAGASSAGTSLFRWTADATAPGGGFWIYNLDSKYLNLLIGKLYRIDIRVGGSLATGYTWALLSPVK